MPEPTIEPKVDPVVDPAPDPSPGKKPDEEPPRTWTDEEVKAKLKGSGKELTKLQAENEALAQWKKEKEAEALTETERKDAEIAELKTRAARADELETEKKARLDRLTERNEERIKALPDKETRAAAKKWTDRLGPEDMADMLGDLEARTVTRDVAHGGRVAPSPDEMDDAAWNERMAKWGQAITRGEKFEEAKK